MPPETCRDPDPFDPASSALVLVDVQTGFRNGYTCGAMDRIAGFLGMHSSDFRVVLATRFLNRHGSNFDRTLHWTGMTGPDGIGLESGVTPFLDAVVDKCTYDGSGALDPLLGRAGVRSVALAGVDTDACVLATAFGLFDLGYRVRVLPDLCASAAGAAVSEAALGILRRNVDPVMSPSYALFRDHRPGRGPAGTHVGEEAAGRSGIGCTIGGRPRTRQAA